MKLDVRGCSTAAKSHIHSWRNKIRGKEGGAKVANIVFSFAVGAAVLVAAAYLLMRRLGKENM